MNQDLEFLDAIYSELEPWEQRAWISERVKEFDFDEILKEYTPREILDAIDVDKLLNEIDDENLCQWLSMNKNLKDIAKYFPEEELDEIREDNNENKELPKDIELTSSDKLKAKLKEVVENKLNRKGWLELVENYGKSNQTRMTICQLERVFSATYDSDSMMYDVLFDYNLKTFPNKPILPGLYTFIITNEDRTEVEVVIHNAQIHCSFNGLHLFAPSIRKVGTFWIARDRDDKLALYSVEPHKIESFGYWAVRGQNAYIGCLGKYLFPEVKWNDNKPRKVKIELIDE